MSQWKLLKDRCGGGSGFALTRADRGMAVATAGGFDRREDDSDRSFGFVISQSSQFGSGSSELIIPGRMMR
jgi:hypothetical protein